MRSDHLSKHLKTHQAKKSGGAATGGTVHDGINDADEASAGNLTANDSEQDMGDMTTIEDQDDLAINESGEGDEGKDIIVGPDSALLQQ